MAQWVKDLAFSLLWCGFDPCPGTATCYEQDQKEKRRGKKCHMKGPCGDGLALYLDTSYTCDRVVQTKLTHTHTHTHTHTDMSTGKIGKSDKLRGCSNINIMAVIL